MRILHTLLSFYKEIIQKRDTSDLPLDSFPIEKIATEKLNLILSHNNYMTNIGGTEKVILEQINRTSNEGFKNIQIFPSDVSNKTCKYGVNLQSEFIGYFDINEILKCFERITFQSIFFHHTYGSFNWSILSRLLRLKSSNQPTFYLHDFFTVCPGTNLRCFNSPKGVKSCSTSNCSQSIEHGCSTLFSTTWVFFWRLVSRSVLKKCKIIAPSEFLKQVYVKEFGYDKIEVRPPALLIPNTILPKIKKPTLRVSFLGYDAEHKGIKNWEKIVSSIQNKQYSSVEFFHIGRASNKLNNVSYFDYNFATQGANKPVQIMIEQDIDIVLLLSEVPESFSFTLHEAMAAGCFVVTTKKSGNIAYYLQNKPNLGLVFENEKEIIEYLLEESKDPLSSKKSDRSVCTIVPNPNI